VDIATEDSERGLIHGGPANSFPRTQPWYFTEEILRSYMLSARPYLTGSLLDAGCGARRYKDMFATKEFVGIEINDKFSPDVVGDLREMPFKGGKFDSILNNQVLEHVGDTNAVFSEFHRVLKKGGHLCITVPFIARTHEVPHDYWRFSEYGLRFLFKRHGFEEVIIQNMGGFLTTQAYLWMFWLWEIFSRSRAKRCIRIPLMVFGNYAALFLHKIDHDQTTPFNYFAVARKP
jgi:SAM-dependent methyltransferase